MKVYMFSFGGVDASAGSEEVPMSSPAQVGDLVLGIVRHDSGGTQTSVFASSVTQSVIPGQGAVLVQNSGNLSGKTLIAIMQRGTDLTLSGEVDLQL
jgi:hypothetical protein